jgi:hypothetical protein
MTRIESLVQTINKINNSDSISNEDALFELLVEIAYSVAVIADKLIRKGW